MTPIKLYRAMASRAGHGDSARGSRKPNVLFIVNSLEVGGAEKHVVTLLNHLDTSRFGLHLAYLKRKEQLLAQLLPGRLQELVCCDVQRGIERRALDRLRRLIAEKDIDVILCTNPYSMLYGSLARAGSRTRPRLVTVFHTTLLESFKKKVQMFLYRHLFARCDLIVYVSENQRRYWRNRGITGAPDCVVYNGIDVQRFAADALSDRSGELRRSMGFDTHDYVIGLCSVLRPEKAHGDLLQAVARLRSQGIPAKALLIGDGPERANVERKVAELRLHDHVTITGMTSDVRPYIGCCDVMALVSHSVETFSLAALESMALGKAVVMSDIGGASEQVIDGRNGLLFEAGNIAALTGHLSALSSESLRRRMGDCAANRVRELFTLEAMIRGFSQRIEGVLAAGSPSLGFKPLRRT